MHITPGLGGCQGRNCRDKNICPFYIEEMYTSWGYLYYIYNTILIDMGTVQQYNIRVDKGVY